MAAWIQSWAPFGFCTSSNHAPRAGPTSRCRQGLNSMVWCLPTGAYDPRKHASYEACARAELSEEAHLAGGAWVSLMPDGHPGIPEVKWCRCGPGCLVASHAWPLGCPCLRSCVCYTTPSALPYVRPSTGTAFMPTWCWTHSLMRSRGRGTRRNTFRHVCRGWTGGGVGAANCDHRLTQRRPSPLLAGVPCWAAGAAQPYAWRRDAAALHHDLLLGHGAHPGASAARAAGGAWMMIMCSSCWCIM